MAAREMLQHEESLQICRMIGKCGDTLQLAPGTKINNPRESRGLCWDTLLRVPA
jgi:hypothetical protein